MHRVDQRLHARQRRVRQDPVAEIDDVAAGGNASATGRASPASGAADPPAGRPGRDSPAPRGGRRRGAAARPGLRASRRRSPRPGARHTHRPGADASWTKRTAERPVSRVASSKRSRCGRTSRVHSVEREQASPGVEELHRVGAGRDLGVEIARHQGRSACPAVALSTSGAPAARARKRGESRRAPALHQIRRQRPRGTGESEQRGPAAQFGLDDRAGWR